MPQQTTKLKISRTAATSRLMLNPKIGKTNRPIKGRVHIQSTMASATSSKWQEIRFNTEVLLAYKLVPILQS